MTNSIAVPDVSGGAYAAGRTSPAYQAYRLLQLGFVAAPILAGADKFLHLLTNWDQYLAPWVAKLSPVPGHTLMLGAGVVEMAAGVLVALKPRLGAPVVGAWLCLIIVNLVSSGAYFDVALRDLGLALGAFALGRRAAAFGR